jgi:transcriptional regulator with PAS, ATPase and Fis domain
MDAVRRLKQPLLRLWRALLEESGPTLAMPAERIEDLTPELAKVIEKAEQSAETLTVAEPSEAERVLIQISPKGLPHLSDLRDLARTRDMPVSLREVERIAIGRSPAFKKVLELALRIAPTKVPVTLLGETGVGKELFANIIHSASPRNAGPLVAVNCGAVAESLYATELFGYEPGSFTGANREGRVGKIEAADGGTLFLDEIGELSGQAQTALLRFLDSGEVQKIGKAKPIHANVRIVCASNRPLEELIANGTFRQDLYYRLALFPITIPPLRQRRQDIPLLASHFLDHAMVRHGSTTRYHFSQETMRFLSDLDWPGNVRQLAFAVERAVLLSRHEELTPSDFHFLQTESAGISQDLSAQVAHQLQNWAGSLSGEIERWAAVLARQGRTGLSNRDIVRAFNVSETAARDRLKFLCAKGILVSRGEKRGRKYFLNPELFN